MGIITNFKGKLEIEFLLGELEQSLRKMDLYKFFEIYLSPKFSSDYPPFEQDQGYDPERVSSAKGCLQKLFNELMESGETELDSLNAHCSQDWCENDPQYNHVCFVGRKSQKCFVLKHWYDEEMGFRLQTCTSLLVPDEVSHYERLFLDENWKDSSFYLTWDGGGLSDMFS